MVPHLLYYCCMPDDSGRDAGVRNRCVILILGMKPGDTVVWILGATGPPESTRIRQRISYVVRLEVKRKQTALSAFAQQAVISRWPMKNETLVMLCYIKKGCRGKRRHRRRTRTGRCTLVGTQNMASTHHTELVFSPMQCARKAMIRAASLLNSTFSSWITVPFFESMSYY